MNSLKDQIKAEASRLGFSFTGFSRPQQTPHFINYKNWINGSQPEELDYLKMDYVIEARNQPTLLLENAQTVIVLGIAYPNQDSTIFNGISDKKRFGQIASYACLPDYHRWFKDHARKLEKFIRSLDNPGLKTRVFVDSGPVMEKDFAYQAGLGWIGKNSLFISPIFGSFCLLGCLFLNLDLEPDIQNDNDLCGVCELCIQSCPSGAISNDRTINANRCISFLTTNYKGAIPPELFGKIGKQVFGCDICQTVCPINNKGSIKNSQKNRVSPIIENRVDLSYELSLGEKLFHEKYSATPIAKLPHEVFLRNLIIAAGNSGVDTFVEPLENIMQSNASFVIQSTAEWAIASLV